MHWRERIRYFKTDNQKELYLDLGPDGLLWENDWSLGER